MIKPTDLRGKRVLISPLNWGMGHVSRCIGIIHNLLVQENEVFIACDESQKSVFSEYFENITFIAHAEYPFHFGGKGNFGWDLLSRSNSLRKRLNQEREEVKGYVGEHKIDVVLSDHRYGFISDEVPSIFITHQVHLPVKWYEKGVGALHTKLMKRFEFIWVLDDEKSTLAGKLSENCPNNACYIGYSSRFSVYADEVEKEYDNVLVASGPSVYAEELIHHFLNRTDEFENLLVIHSTSMQMPAGVTAITGSWKEKDHAIRKAKRIISRSGYSTIMDCQYLNVSGLFIPTQGQAEQEYLAERYLQK
ncbi:MAG: glycosyltransferase [Crocinitomicaceae bacterium]|nr:glycosyltransferase [Crocinitomicaceae bacterium]